MCAEAVALFPKRRRTRSRQRKRRNPRDCCHQRWDRGFRQARATPDQAVLGSTQAREHSDALSMDGTKSAGWIGAKVCALLSMEKRARVTGRMPLLKIENKVLREAVQMLTNYVPMR